MSHAQVGFLTLVVVFFWTRSLVCVAISLGVGTISKRKRRRLGRKPSSGTAQANGEAGQADTPPSSSLARLLGHVKYFSEFRDFDKHMSATRTLLPERQDRNQSIEIAWRLFELGRDHCFVLRGIGLKLAEVGRGFLAAKAERNPTVVLTLD
jgi:hypothetical protein